MAGRRYAVARAVHVLLVSHRVHAVQRGDRHRLDERGHAAGAAPEMAGAASGRAGQDVSPAQVVGHRRPGGRHRSLVVGKRHQMDGGLGLAGKARAQTGGRRNPRQHRRLAAQPAGV